MSKQSDIWSGEFGNQYTDRNNIRWQDNLPIFKAILDGLLLDNVLEVGCNKGHNLLAITELIGCGHDIVGVEPNEYAASLARRDGLAVFDGNAYNLQFENNEFDLVFTMGVLVHIAPEDLTTAINEMYRVSNKYILAIEYAAKEETSIHYHGRDDLLWKRDFHEAFKTAHPDLQLIKHWKWGTEDRPFYDRLDGWLFEKEK